jgi:alpha/beta hydrolase family protein
MRGRHRPDPLRLRQWTSSSEAGPDLGHTSEPTPRLVEVSGGELYVEEHGEGFPLLLIQGLGYAVWAWRFQVPAFAEHWRTIAFDNRGAGRSFKPLRPYTIEQLVDDAATVLDMLGREPGSLRRTAHSPARVPDTTRMLGGAVRRVRSLRRGWCAG